MASVIGMERARLFASLTAHDQTKVGNLMFQYAQQYPRGLFAAVACAIVAGAAFGQTNSLAHPKGEVILTIEGAVGNTNGNDTAAFDMDMLMAMPAVSFTTSTTWTEGTPTFTGVPLKTLLQSVGAEGSAVAAIALNNYSVSIPMAELTDETPIVAYHIDGATFSRRDKGPLWIVYPYDSDPAYQNELIYGRSIWQLSRLTVN